MYTEEYEKRQFPFRDFLLKIILVIIFVFLLVWLLPKFIAPSTSNVTDISPLTSQIFGDNLEKMKEAAISYYTTERLPSELGESKKMTLREMIANNLVIPFVDKNGKACDVDDSYVKITKEENEYLLKVNLKCSDQEDYILVHLGCYNYCESGVCEKEAPTIAYKESTPTKVINITGNNNNGGNGGGSTPPDTPTPTPTPEDPDPVIPDPPDDKNLLYEYSKTTGAKYSEWTKWSPWQPNNNNIQSLNCNDSDPNCVKKVQLYSRKEQIGTYDKAYKTSRNEVRQMSSYQEVACSEYNYVRIDETTYYTTTTTDYTTSWTYQGTTNQAYNDTPTTKYVLEGADFSNCSTTCTSLPTFRYKKYTLNGGLTNTTASSSPSTTSLTSTKDTKKVNTSIKVSCAKTTTKTIPVYRTITTYDIAYRKEPLYGTVHYYSEKTRTVIDKGSTDVKWSTYNDTSLLKAGYHYTGNTKVK